MKLALVQYRCATCAHAFDAPELDPNSYGEFLLRSGFNEMAYLDATRDETYDEVDRLLVQLPRVAGMRKRCVPWCCRRPISCTSIGTVACLKNLCFDPCHS